MYRVEPITMRQNGAGRALLVLVAVAVAAGCGTTVTGVPASTGASASDGLSAPLGIETPGGGATQSPDAGLPTASEITSPRGDGTNASVAASQSHGPTSARETSSTGEATKKPIPIGFTILPDASAFFASFGASSSTGNQASEVRAAVKWVNAHGGLNGHPIDPKIEALSATSTQSYASQYQALCTKYTQDEHVVAATILPTGANDNMDACMTRAHTLFVTGSNTLHNVGDYQRHPYVVSPSEVTISALAQAMTREVLKRHAVAKGGRLGLINYDLPGYNAAIAHYVKPMLAAAGIGLTQYTIPPPASTGDIGNSVSVDASAELKMKVQGINTVMFLCSGCLAFFAQAAKTQDYHPAYVFSSMDTPVAGTDAELFTKSFGVGFSPVTQDQYVFHNKAFSGNPTFDRCAKIETAAGQATNKTSLAFSVALCDAVMSIYNASLANPSEPVTSDSLLEGMLSEGGRYPSALSFATDLSPQRHAGAATYRAMDWSKKCKCLAYTGPTLPFSAI